MQSNVLVAKDTGSVLSCIVKDPAGGNIPDIISATLRWRVGTGAVKESAMNVDSNNSRVWYQFQKIAGQGEDPDTWELTPGTLRAEVVIIDAAGGELTSGEVIAIDVRDRL